MCHDDWSAWRKGQSLKNASVERCYFLDRRQPSETEYATPVNALLERIGSLALNLSSPFLRWGFHVVLSVKVPYASVAQLVEQVICNHQVEGSSPFGSSSRCLELPVIRTPQVVRWYASFRKIDLKSADVQSVVG